MNNDIIQCIKKYSQENYRGGLIGISDLAKYCNESEGMIFKGLVKLEKSKEFRIITRHFCPETHIMSNESTPYCESCNLRYSNELVNILVYCQPISSISQI
jgi:hypothetical protein